MSWPFPLWRYHRSSVQGTGFFTARCRLPALLLTATAACGCWTDIPYEPPAKQSPEPEVILPADSFAKDVLPTKVAAAPEPLPLPGLPKPVESPEPAEEATPVVVEATPQEIDEDGDWFGEELAAAAEEDAHLAAEEQEPATPPAEATDSSGESLLPWGDQEEAETTDEVEAEKLIVEEPRDNSKSDDPSLLFPWEKSTAAQEQNEETIPVEAEPVEVEAMEEVTPAEDPVEPIVEKTLSEAADAQAHDAEEEAEVEPPSVEPVPVAVDPQNTRHLAWLLASKMSYSMITPEARVTEELDSIAALLGVQLPEAAGETDEAETERLRRLLGAGRELGTQVASSQGVDHTALVEVAFKSNLLIEIYPTKPHLIHAVNGSVAAAAVRARLPDEVWQTWQDQVADADSIEQIEQSVIELHLRIDEYLRQRGGPVSDDTPAVLR